MDILNKYRIQISKKHLDRKKGRFDDKDILISTILINWNRSNLLKKTVESYLDTISVPYELIIVDSASTDGSKEYIEKICNENNKLKGILLTEDFGGGNAINLGLAIAQGSYLHVSENDIEYLPGWDRELLNKFHAFPKLGLISLFSANLENKKEEIWRKQLSKSISNDGQTIDLAEKNITSSCIFRGQLWDEGLRWKTIISGGNKFPNDRAFSRAVKSHGYQVAWNDHSTVINWGHNVEEWIDNLEYYISNYKSKPWIGINGFKQLLLENGYELIEDEKGKFNIIKHNISI